MELLHRRLEHICKTTSRSTKRDKKDTNELFDSLSNGNLSPNWGHVWDFLAESNIESSSMISLGATKKEWCDLYSNVDLPNCICDKDYRIVLYVTDLTRIKTESKTLANKLAKCVIAINNIVGLNEGVCIGFAFVHCVPYITLEGYIFRDRQLTVSPFNYIKHLKGNIIGRTTNLLELSRIINFSLPVQVYIDTSNYAGDESIYRIISEINTISKNSEFGGFSNLFVHASLRTNLSNPSLKLDELIKDINLGKALNSRGVVVHVGINSANLVNKQVAIGRMTKNIKTLLTHTTEFCPLILETPAGETGELLSEMQDFLDYYQSFSAEEKIKFKICIDTCHVYAAGYEPLEYLTTAFNNLGSNSIRLIHFNDSSHGFGSHVDRHFPVCGGNKTINKIISSPKLLKKCFTGEFGYIGPDNMAKIAKFCIDRDIPMVTE